LFYNIQWRITFPFVLLILIIMGILGVYLVNSTRNHQLDNLRAQLENEARITAEASLPGFLSPDRAQILSDIANKLGEQINTRVTIVALDGNVLGDSEEDPATIENHAARPEIRDALSTGLGESTRYSTTLEQKMMYIAVPISHQGEVLGIARVALPLKEVESLVRRVTVSIATATAIAALLAILAAWVIARVTTRPIREITTASKKIASGELEQRISIDTGDEVEELAHSFNEMSSKLKELVDAISGDKARLETILDNMADGVIMTDKEGNISLANRAVKAIRIRHIEKISQGYCCSHHQLQAGWCPDSVSGLNRYQESANDEARANWQYLSRIQDTTGQHQGDGGNTSGRCC
jgi:two-component system phosphate regulon sensor histidine kinase PhoR